VRQKHRREIRVDSSVIEGRDAASHGAGRRSDSKANGSSEEPDKPAERRSPKGANGKISFRLGSDAAPLR